MAVYYNASIQNLTDIHAKKLLKARNDLCKEYKITVFNNISERQQTLVTVFGRVYKGIDGNGNENEVVFLKGDNSSGQSTLLLNFSQLEQKGVLFNGQVVAIQGMNPSGSLLMVKKVFNMPFSFLNYPYLNAVRKNTEGIVFSGPMCDGNTFNFNVLEKFMTLAVEKKPKILIINGPIIPKNHEMLATERLEVQGVVCETITDIYSYVFARLAKLAEALPGSFVFVLPSTSEYCKEVCLPQLPYTIGMIEPKPSNLFFANNPSTLRIPSISTVISVTTDDVVADLESNIISLEEQVSKDQILRFIADHILRERHIYPSFPCKKIPIDFTLDDKLSLHCIPDILILPRSTSTYSNTTIQVNSNELEKSVLVLSPSNVISHATEFMISSSMVQPSGWPKFKKL